MRLYTIALAPNALRVLMLLKEKSIDIEVVELDPQAEEHKTPEFLAINPLGQVPALQLDDGTCIAESLPISRYLDTISGAPRLFGDTPEAQAVIGMWERRAELGVFTPAVEYGHHTQPMMAEFFTQYPDWGNSMTTTVQSCLTLLDARLGESEWLGGDDFSIADITAYAGYGVAAFWDMPLGDGPNIGAWFDRMGARPCASVIPL
jgi:glutathione S-transferase